MKGWLHNLWTPVQNEKAGPHVQKYQERQQNIKLSFLPQSPCWLAIAFSTCYLMSLKVRNNINMSFTVHIYIIQCQFIIQIQEHKTCMHNHQNYRVHISYMWKYCIKLTQLLLFHILICTHVANAQPSALWWVRKWKGSLDCPVFPLFYSAIIFS